MFEPKAWSKIKMGELIKVYKDEDFPCDLLVLKSSHENGVVFVDTMQLDGETNLKEKTANKTLQALSDQEIKKLSGECTCDSPNENLEDWDCNVNAYINGSTSPFLFNSGIPNLCLRGSVMRSNEWCLGVAIYTGKETKIF